jgi:hypothetical protein
LIQLVSIVEGQGEVEAVTILVRRIARELDPGLLVQAHPPFRISRGKLLKPGGLEHYVEVAVRRAGRGGVLLIVLDSDDDCPAELGPRLRSRVYETARGFAASVCLAHREFEAWFLAAAESLRGQRGLIGNLASPPDPEVRRDAKGWLSAQMEAGRSYVPSLDQPVMAALFDLAAARRRSLSFDRFYREVSRLLTGGVGPTAESAGS